MITFVSIFLGLVVGAQSVQVAVSEEVAEVRIELDGQPVATLTRPPWAAHLELGKELAPHEVVGVALDAEGNELERARQWLNLPRQPAEARLVLEGGIDGHDRVARLTWDSLAGAGRPKIRVSFDGRPLVVPDPTAIALPTHDPEQLHFLRAELEFAGNLTSKAELTFGGAYTDQVSTELTAVPLVVERGRQLPAPQELGGWFTKKGAVLEVMAVEAGPAEVVMVRDPGVQEMVDALRPDRRSAQRPTRVSERRRQRAREDWRLQFMWPVSYRRGEKRSYDLFPFAGEFTAVDGDLLRMLQGVRLPPELTGRRRIADALAVAGVSAAAGRCRRAVVLFLGPEPTDQSDLAAPLARRYLEHLQVPLVVWSTGSDAAEVTAVWGEPLRVSNRVNLAGAWRKLRDELERQRIVWLRGVHLPQEIELTEHARGVRIAG